MFAAVTELACDQHALVRHDQVIERGGSDSWLRNQCKAGRLERRAPRVYALPGAPATRVQQLLVHVFAAGPVAYATADSALGLWSPELPLPTLHEIVVPRGRRYRAAGVRVRESRDLDLAIPGVRDSVPVVGVARALLDASDGLTPDEVLRRIDACNRHLSISPGALVHALRTHERHGRRGITTFRAALRQLGRSVPDSDFERYVSRDLVAAGLPKPRHHHVVRVPGKQPIELDFDFPPGLVNVELDGADHVARARRARRDRQRDRLLQSIGYEVLRYTWDDYVEDGAGMIEEIAGFLERAGIWRR